MTITGTIHWAAPSTNKPGVFTVVVQPEGPGLERKVLWTKDAWLASLCQRYNQTPRPVLSVTFDVESRHLDGVALPVAA